MILWPLPGLEGLRFGALLSAALLATVAVSRVAFLPDGPWEQDEAILASAVLEFDVPDHRPHPPAFPGLVAMGRLVNPFVGDPLLSLRLISSASSVGILILLTALLSWTGLRGRVALAGALLYSALPGVWAHSARAFSTTPAVFFGLLSVWCLLATHRGDRYRYGAWLSLAWALAVRPQFVVLVPLFLALTLRSRWWRTWQGWGPAVAAVTLLSATAALVIVDSGGVARLRGATEGQAAHHFLGALSRGFDHPWELGVVRGLSGEIPAVAWGAASLIGVFVVGRRAGVSVMAWLVAATAIVLAALAVLHDAYLPRYTPIAYVCTLPLVIHALDAVLGRASVPAVASIAILAAWESAPVVSTMSRQPLPVVAALRHLHTEGWRGPLLYSEGLFAFVRFQQELHPAASVASPMPPPGELTARFLAGLVRPTGSFLWLDDAGQVLPGLTVRRRLYEDFPLAAWELSQRRYDRVELIRDAPVWLDGRHDIERTQQAERFAWLAPRAALWLPPGSRGLRLALEVPRRLRRTQAVTVRANGRTVLNRRLADEFVNLSIPAGTCQGGCVLDLLFLDSFVSAGDGRRLAARANAAWLEGLPVAPFTLNPGRPREIRAFDVTLSGVHDPEVFEDGLPGAWTDGSARIEMPGGNGQVQVTLANPGGRAGIVTLRTDGAKRPCPARETPSVCKIEVEGVDGRFWLEIGSSSFQPEGDSGFEDSRRLGVRVHDITFQPSARRSASEPSRVPSR